MIRDILEPKLASTSIEDIKLPMRVYETLKEIRDSDDKLGLSICLGYDDSMGRHVYKMDYDIYENFDYSIMDDDHVSHIMKSSELDGAILIDKDGNLKHSGMYFGHAPNITLRHMGIGGEDKPLWERFGFKINVCTRHLSAISTSYHMPEALIYVLSEEYNLIRVFHRGEILYSPFEGEVK